MTLTDVKQRHPQWHIWRSEPRGLLWAPTTRCHDPGGCGTTLVGDDPDELDAAITAFETKEQEAA